MGALFAAFGIEWQLLLAQGVNFAIVLVALTYFFYKPVLKMLKEREEKIAGGVRDAEAAARAKSEIEAARDSIISKASADAAGIAARGVEEGKRERAQIIKEAQARAEEVLKSAELQAAEAMRSALKESEKEITRSAILAAEKILAKHS